MRFAISKIVNCNVSSAVFRVHPVQNTRAKRGMHARQLNVKYVPHIGMLVCHHKNSPSKMRNIILYIYLCVYFIQGLALCVCVQRAAI